MNVADSEPPTCQHKTRFVGATARTGHCLCDADHDIHQHPAHDCNDSMYRKLLADGTVSEGEAANADGE